MKLNMFNKCVEENAEKYMKKMLTLIAWGDLE